MMTVFPRLIDRCRHNVCFAKPNLMQVMNSFHIQLLCLMIRYGDSVENSVEENSSIFSLIRIRWLLSARA